MDIPTIVNHWKTTGGAYIVVRDAMRDALHPTTEPSLHPDEAREVLICQDYQMTLVKGAVSNVLSALDVLGLPDTEEWEHIEAQAELLRQIIDEL